MFVVHTPSPLVEALQAHSIDPSTHFMDRLFRA